MKFVFGVYSIIFIILSPKNHPVVNDLNRLANLLSDSVAKMYLLTEIAYSVNDKQKGEINVT